MVGSGAGGVLLAADPDRVAVRHGVRLPVIAGVRDGNHDLRARR